MDWLLGNGGFASTRGGSLAQDLGMAHRSICAALGGCIVLFVGVSFAQEGGESVGSPTAGSGASRGAVATPFLYQITGKGTAAFLYGTVHLPDKRVVTLPDSVVAAFDASDVFFAEIEATAASEAKVQSMATMPQGQSLQKVLGPATWARIEARFIKAGQPAALAAALSRFEPWAFSSLLPMLDYLDEMATQPALDKMLYQRAEKAGKAVAGLESVEEQVAVFQSFTRAEQVQMLRDSLDLLDKYEAQGRNVMEEMIGAWMSGDSATLVQLLDDGFGSDPVIRERAEQELLWKRNARFAERMDAAMVAFPAKTSFFAIGALHLPNAPKIKGQPPAGPGMPAKLGIPELMRQRGYTVTRLGLPAPVTAGQ